MSTYTSSLPDQVLEKLSEISAQLKVPKNQIIERALTNYLDEIERQMFVRSYKKLADDPEIFTLAEEGLGLYRDELNAWEDEKG